MNEHLGYERHDPAGRDGGNSRNGTRTKTVLTEIGPVQIEVPRDRDASFDPVIVRKRQRRLDGIDEIVLSLTVFSTTRPRLRHRCQRSATCTAPDAPSRAASPRHRPDPGRSPPPRDDPGARPRGSRIHGRAAGRPDRR
jgi:hypothetical protein